MKNKVLLLILFFGIVFTMAPASVFAMNNKEINEKYNCLGVEMESFALFNTARILNKEAACLLTISNSLVDGSTTSSEERQNKFFDMIEVALNIL